MPGRVQLKVNLRKLADNFACLRRRVAPCRVIAVVKANAYGLGIIPVAEALKHAGADILGVATMDEAREVIHLGLPVQILGVLTSSEVAEAVKSGVICPVGSLSEAEALSHEGVKQKRKIPVAFIVDTGMGRLGFTTDRAPMEIAMATELPNLEARGLYTHLSSAAMLGDDYSAKQISLFKILEAQLRDNGITFADIHIAASDAINFFPETLTKPFNLVRAGLLMSSYDSKLSPELETLASIVEITTTLAAVRKLPAGSAIGYRRTHILAADTLVGTIPAGYADGVPVAISNRGFVLVNGVKCQVIGRVSMDYTMVSLAQLPDAKPGDEVVLIGRRADSEITIDDWARYKGSFNHEILCALSNRLDKVYIR